MRVWVDGNPERCCIVIEDEMPRIFEYEEELNSPYCEFKAILKGAKMISKREVEEVELINDNLVVVKQLSMDYEIKSDKVREYAEKIWEIFNKNEIEVEFRQVSRDENKAGKPLG